MRMNLGSVLLAPVLCCSLACGGGAPPASAPSSVSAGGAGETAAPTKPDRNKATVHLKEHVKYPVARTELLKACADTPEFTAGEKKWFEANVPDGVYKSADEVIAAMKL